MTKKKIIVSLIGLLISVLCIVFALQVVDFSELVDVLKVSDYWLAFPMLVTFALYYLVKCERWRILLKPLRETTNNDLISPMMVGFFFNNIFPAHLGEFCRMYLAGKLLNLKNSQVLGTIILERIFDIVAIVILSAVALYWGSAFPILRDYILDFVLISIVITVVLAILVIYYRKLPEARISNALRQLLNIIPSKIKQQIEFGVDGLKAAANPKLFLWILATSILQWLFMGVTIYFALMAVNIDASLQMSIVTLALIIFAVIIPSAPGFFGSIQVAFLFALAPFGILESDAIAASLFFHFFTYFFVIIWGVISLHLVGYSLSSMRKELGALQEDKIDGDEIKES